MVEFKEAPTGGPKKHRCPDCRFCQFCADSRCQACRDGRPKPPRLSCAEQIALFDRLNEGDPHRPGAPIFFRNPESN